MFRFMEGIKMKNSNKGIIDEFFDAYGKHDLNGIMRVMEDRVTWSFMGDHPLAGIKNGIDEVIAFFDAMGEIMNRSNIKMEKLIEAENEHYFIECQHSKTNRMDGNNLDHYTCVLWTIKDGKITEGRHFFANPQAANKYFSSVATQKRS